MYTQFLHLTCIADTGQMMQVKFAIFTNFVDFEDPHSKTCIRCELASERICCRGKCSYILQVTRALYISFLRNTSYCQVLYLRYHFETPWRNLCQFSPFSINHYCRLEPNWCSIITRNVDTSVLDIYNVYLVLASNLYRRYRAKNAGQICDIYKFS